MASLIRYFLSKPYIESVMFFPPKPLLKYPTDVADIITAQAETVYNECKVPCVVVEHPDAEFSVVYFHGNNENLRTMYNYLSDLSQSLKSSVFAFEYPGYYEDSMDTLPSEDGCYAAAEAFVKAVHAASDRKVILFGYSMGCALALHTADVHRADNTPHAVVLLAPFISAASVVLARSATMVSLTSLWSPFDVFVVKPCVLHQGHPLYVVVGEKDTVVPPAHGEAIAKYSGQHGVSRLLKIPEATHATVRVYAEVYEELGRFLHDIK
jgi:pimeloyl-ACP methyl ester carboxylesterase